VSDICILIPDCLERSMGGMGVLCRGILSSLSLGHNITVIGTPQEEISYPFCSYKSITPVNIMSGQYDPIIFHLLNQTAYVDEVNLKPNIVHCFDWSTFGAGLYLKQKYNCKLVCSVQLALDDIVEPNRIHPFQRSAFDSAKALELQGLNEADVVIQVSRHYARKYFMFLNKTVVINNGINLDDFTIKDKIDLPGKDLRLLYIGRYAEMKNTHTLSSITLPDGVDLLFAGSDKGSDPDIWDLTMKNIEQNPNMHYIGPYYGEGKVKLFNSVDGVIFPSLREPFGIVGLEALASGKVLLASNVDGMKDYLQEGNYIDCGITRESIEKSIQEFIVWDRKAIIKKGLSTVKDFTWTRQSGLYNKVYNLLK
jgi:glycosyltransferase involved in cell wall biosynthesis